MKKDKPIPDPIPKAFHDLLDKAAKTQLASVPSQKGEPGANSAQPAKENIGRMLCGALSRKAYYLDMDCK